jgi:hypothetical protein
MVKHLLMQDQDSKADKDIAKFYCRIETFCISNINLSEFKKEKCFSIKDNINYNQKKEYDVFAKEFNDFNPVVSCLYEIESAWKILQEGKEVIEDCMELGASIMIYNQCKIDLYIGMYNNKWFLSHLSKYTNEWKENYSRNIKNNSGGSVILHIPFYQDEDIDEFISKEKVCALLKEWLETSKYAVDFDSNEKITYMKKILNESSL